MICPLCQDIMVDYTIVVFACYNCRLTYDNDYDMYYKYTKNWRFEYEATSEKFNRLMKLKAFL